MRSRPPAGGECMRRSARRGGVRNHKKLKRLMREHRLNASRRRRYVTTTDSDHDQPVFPDRTKDMIVEGPKQLWVADLTYVAVAVGFVYVDRKRVVNGHSVSVRVDLVDRPTIRTKQKYLSTKIKKTKN